MSVIIKKKHILLSGVGLLLIAAILAVTFWPRGSKQSDFKLFDNPPMASVGTASFEEQMEYTEVIADVTVEELLPSVTRQYNPTEYEQTVLEMEPFDYTVRRVKLIVNDTWAGTEQQTITLTISPVSSFCVPDFHVGDRFVMILNSYDEGYGFVSVISSCFYVAYDEKVYPGTLQEPTSRASGMSLSDFKNELQMAYLTEHGTLYH